MAFTRTRKERPMSGGIDQRFSNFSYGLDTAMEVFRGMKANKLGFDLTISGDFIPNENSPAGNDFRSDFNSPSKKSSGSGFGSGLKGPDIPAPELQARSRNTPRGPGR